MRKRALLPLIASTAIVAAGTVAWLNRGAIATGYVDAALAERGVRASYAVDSIGVRRQRLRNLIVGDPARPDLTAREVEVELGIGWRGPYVTAVRARGIRLNARWTGERLMLGEVDKLIPTSDGSPFSMPAIGLDLSDASARLDTPWGRIGLAATGAGRLDRAFSGNIAVSAPALRFRGCTLREGRGRVTLRIVDGAPHAEGPIGIGRARCGDTAAFDDLRLGLDARADAHLGRLRGRAGLRGGAVRVADARAERLGGEVTIEGRRARALDARWQLSVGGIEQPWLRARRITLDGSGRRGSDGRWSASSLLALVGGSNGARAEAALAPLAAVGDATPAGPIARKLALALSRAGSGFAATARVGVRGGTGDSVLVSASAVDIAASSGARLALQGEEAVRWSAAEGLALAGTARIGGGGLPEGSVTLARNRRGTSGMARFAPYGADGALVAFAPVSFRYGGGDTRFATDVALSGPIGDGRVSRLSLPLVGTVSDEGEVRFDPGCRPMRWDAIRAAGVVLDRSALTLCSGGLGWSPGRGLWGALDTSSIDLGGRSGGAPLRLTADRARLLLASRSGALHGMTMRVGNGASATSLFATEISAEPAAGGFAGTLRGGGGRIGPTPFDLGDATGRWRWANGALQIDTGLTIEDAAQEDRFQRLVGSAVRVRYADGVVRAEGRLSEARSGAAILDLAVTHAFASGYGAARFTVPGVTFARGGLQPVDVTRLALGVVANVQGSVTGQGEVRWNGDGVQSSGSFSTDRLDLAAAFGPVERLSGTIRFDDLLELTTPPDQEARVGSVNPGIEVMDGRILYQMLPGRRVRIASGTWPFAGGQLLLQPALLDFGADRPRRLTFDLSDADAALFLQRYDFENISATGTFDGVLPTVFDADGGRVVGGILVSRDGGGTLAYVGELSNRDLGVMANMAYGALRSLRYDNLVVRLNGDIDGEMVTELDFSGLAQGEGASRNLLTRAIARLPFTFRIRINAPFRQLLSSARGLYDPTTLIEQNLPDLLRAEREAGEETPAAATAVQPSESEDRR